MEKCLLVQVFNNTGKKKILRFGMSLFSRGCWELLVFVSLWQLWHRTADRRRRCIVLFTIADIHRIAHQQEALTRVSQADHAICTGLCVQPGLDLKVCASFLRILILHSVTVGPTCSPWTWITDHMCLFSFFIQLSLHLLTLHKRTVFERIFSAIYTLPATFITLAENALEITPSVEFSTTFGLSRKRKSIELCWNVCKPQMIQLPLPWPCSIHSLNFILFLFDFCFSLTFP